MNEPKLTGTIIGKGRYEIRELIGHGHSGEVYSALDLHANPPTVVAVKRVDLESESQGRSSGLSQLHRECLALSQIGHSAIVKIFDISVDERQVFIVEELLHGGNLATRIIHMRDKNQAQGHSTGAMSPEEVARIGLMLARGLSEIHARGFFHGDIKPTNIGYRDRAHHDPVLLDFGQSDFSDALILKNEGTQKASLPYLPPEISGFLGEIECVPRDLYSLGVTLYECAVGNVPFEDLDPKLIIRRVLTEVPPPVSSVVPGFPESLSNVIFKLMRKQPSDRYHTAMGLAADLEFCLEAICKGEIPRIFALGRKDKIRELNYRIPMIGRQEEIECLRKGLQGAQAGKGEIFFIAAPSGTGKSRLSLEFASEAHSKGIGAIFTKFSEFERNLPFSAIHSLINEISQRLGKASKAQLENWKNRVQNKLQSHGNLIAERFSDLKTYLPVFPPLRPMEHEESSQAFLTALATFLTLLDCDDSGQVIILDDLQWADASSIDMIREIVNLSNENSLEKTVVVGTFRINEVEQDHPLMTKVLCQTRKEQRIELGPLSRKEAKTLVELIIDERGPEVDKLFDFTFRMSLGNPFFSYECLKSLISSEAFAFQEDRGTWLFDEKKQMKTTISSGMAELVSDRIKRIPQLEREALIIASVVGSKFPLPVLSHLVKCHILNQITDESEGELVQYRHENPDILTRFIQNQLAANQLISPCETDFIFFHDKVREAAIALASKELQVAVHQTCGEYLAAECLTTNEHKQVTSQQLYDASFHLMRGNASSCKPMARTILLMAAQRAVQVFAYQKALDYLETAASLFDIAPQGNIRAEDRPEWIVINELMADALGLSRRVEEAVDLFDLVYEIVEDPLHKAEICAKRVDYNLALFRYKNSITAGKEGLQQVGVKPCDSELSAFFTILLWTPWLVALYFWFHFFGTQKQKTLTPKDTIRLKLTLAYQVPTYFSRPLIAIAQQYPLTRELLFHKDCDFRAMTIAYWGVVTANIGLPKISERCFGHASTYFDKNPNPVAQGFITFVWGYLLLYPAGRAAEAHRKIEHAYEMLSGVGESFWQYLCLQGLVHLDYFCLGSGEATPCIAKLISLWEQVHFEPCVMGCSLRTFLYEDRTEDLKKWTKITREGGNAVESQGFKSIDLIYSYLQPGEVHLVRGEYDEALPLIEKAFAIVVRHSHRVALCTQSAPLLAQAYIRANRPFKAIFPLAIAYLNPLLSVSVFQPYTYYATGEFLQKIGLHTMGYLVMLRGVHYARVRGWLPVAAEGWLQLGEYLLKRNPDRAEYYLKKALDYFNQRGQKYLAKRAQTLLDAAEEELISLQTRIISDKNTMKNTTTFSLRQEIETSALLEIFLELSSLTQIDSILDAVLEALCRCTGAEIGVIFIQTGDQWVPARSTGIDHETLARGHYGLAGVDKGFFDHCVSNVITEAHVRSAADHSHDFKGSTLVLPLAYKGKTSGMCYLSNRQIKNLFDEKSLQTISPIAAQAAIALQNIELLAETEKKARQIAEHTESLKKLVTAGQNIAAQVSLSTLSQTLIQHLQEFLDVTLDVDILIHASGLHGCDSTELSDNQFYLLTNDGSCNLEFSRQSNQLDDYSASFAVNDPRSEKALAYICLKHCDTDAITKLKPIVEAICTNVASALTTVRLEQVLRLFEERTREIRTIFEHINQGICMVDASLSIGRHLSHEMTVLFGEEVKGKHLQSILENTSLTTDKQHMILSVVDCCIGNDSTAFFVNEQLLPRETKITSNMQERFLELDWTPILNNHEIIQRIMLTVRDVTEFHKLRKTAAVAASEIEKIREVIACDPVVLDDFFTDLHEIGQQIHSLIKSEFRIDECEKANLKRGIHTLKGTGRQLKLASLTDFIHDLESDLLQALASSEYAANASTTILDTLANSTNTCHKYEQIEESLRTRSKSQKNLDQNASLRHIVDNIHQIACDIAKKELKKPEPKLQCNIPDNIFIKRPSAKIVSESLNHIFRNIVDHGLGYNEEGMITLECCESHDQISLLISSTEEGLHLEALEKKIRACNMKIPPVATSDEEIAEFIFNEGITTAENVSQISGRGIGMDAVRFMLSEIGATIHVEFTGPRNENSRRPFRFVISIPAENIATDSSHPSILQESQSTVRRIA